MLLPVQLAVLGLGLVNVLAFVGALAGRARRAPGRRWRRALHAHHAAADRATRSGSLLAAGLALAMYLSGSQLRQIFFYLLGSLRRRGLAEPRRRPARSSSSGRVLIMARARSLNGLLLGDDTARHLGVDVRRERAILLGLASLVTAAAVALAGLIGFVGLVVPHVVRLLVGPNARLVLPLSAIFGAAFLILADLVRAHPRRAAGGHRHGGHRRARLRAPAAPLPRPGTSCEPAGRQHRRPATSACATGVATSCPTSTCTWRPASASASWGPTAPASRACCAA